MLGSEVHAAINVAGLHVIHVHPGFHIHGQRHTRERMGIPRNVLDLHKSLPGHLTHCFL